MEIKKNPEADLEKKYVPFFLVGMVVSLCVCLLAFEWATFEEGAGGLGQLVLDDEIEELIPITQQEITPPPPPPPAPTVIEIVEDEEEIENEVDMDTEFEEEEVIEYVEQEEEIIEEPQIFTIVEEMPSFPGGEEKLFEYLGKNTKYPPMAKDAGISGIVYVNFVVMENGEIKKVKVLREVNPALDKEAIRVVEAMPSWKPGKQRGKAVRVSYNLPIRFILK